MQHKIWPKDPDKNWEVVSRQKYIFIFSTFGHLFENLFSVSVLTQPLNMFYFNEGLRPKLESHCSSQMSENLWEREDSASRWWIISEKNGILYGVQSPSIGTTCLRNHVTFSGFIVPLTVVLYEKSGTCYLSWRIVIKRYTL